jgi:hypothetical protein
MKKWIWIVATALVLMIVGYAGSEEIKIETYRGVVTFQLIPAKVLKINKIIANPPPGTSYIGKEGILVEVDDNPTVMANWTVVNLKYYKYPEPKIIKYELFSEQKQLTVKYHAVSVEIDGDLSAYIPKD